MKRKIIVLLMSIFMALNLLASCAPNDDSANLGDQSQDGQQTGDENGDNSGSSSPDLGDVETESVSITFYMDDASTVYMVQERKVGETLEEPTQPNKNTLEEQFKFLGWFYGESKWDFSQDTVVEGMSLIARFEFLGDSFSPPIVLD